MEKKKLYNDGYYNGVISIVFQDKEYEVDCEATCNIYYSKYEDGFTETELDGVIPCIISIYDIAEQKDVTSELKDNTDFLEELENYLIQDGDNWIDETLERENQIEENNLYWQCELAERENRD